MAEQIDWRTMHATITSGFCLRKIRSVEELETLPSVTMPGISHSQSPGGERRGKRKLRSTIFLKRTREGHRQSDKNWNRLKGDIGETSESVERIWDFPSAYIPSSTELN